MSNIIEIFKNGSNAGSTCTPAVDNPSNLVQFVVQGIIEVGIANCVQTTVTICNLQWRCKALKSVDRPPSLLLDFSNSVHCQFSRSAMFGSISSAIRGARHCRGGVPRPALSLHCQFSRLMLPFALDLPY